MAAYRVEPIANHPELLGAVARWHWDEWGQADPDGSAESWEAALQLWAVRDKIPMLLVALAGASPVGSVSLVENDIDSSRQEWRAVVARWRHAAPWLSGLYVVPEQRRQGIGSALIRACEDQARALSVERLWLYTSDAERLYRNHEYEVVGREFYEGESVVVMSKALRPPASN